MTSIATNANNDIYLDSDGNLAFASGLAAVRQDCEHVMKAQLGEIPLDLTRGVPTLETIWAQYQPAQFEAYARRMLLTVPGVTAVKSFAIKRVGDVAQYIAEIQSTFGPAVVTGSLVQ